MKLLRKKKGRVVIEKIKQGKEIEGEVADIFIQMNAQRILEGIRKDILRMCAPEWENDISYYPEKVPEEFAKEFRQIRNHITGHVSYKRPNINLSEFYQKYHKYVCMMYYNCLGHWGYRNKDIPDLKEITDFSVTIRKK